MSVTSHREMSYQEITAPNKRRQNLKAWSPATFTHPPTSTVHRAQCLRPRSPTSCGRNACLPTSLRCRSQDLSMKNTSGCWNCAQLLWCCQFPTSLCFSFSSSHWVENSQHAELLLGCEIIHGRSLAWNREPRWVMYIRVCSGSDYYCNFFVKQEKLF